MRRRDVFVALLTAGILLWPGVSRAVTVSVLDVSAEPGQAGIVVSIQTDDAKGVAGGTLTLSFDANVLAPKKIDASTLLKGAGITVTSNLNFGPGQVRASLAGTTGIASGGGELVNVTFDVKAGAAPGTYDLGLQATLRDENANTIPVTIRKGTLTIKAVGGTGATGGTGGGGRIISVSDASAEPGQTGLIVPVAVDDAKGIAGGTLTLSFNANVLTPKKIEGARLVTDAGITVTSNLNFAPGQVRASLAGTTGITSGSGALVTIIFDVKAGASAGTYDLGLQATLRDENASTLPATVKNGTLTIKAAPSGPLTPKSGDGSAVLDLNTSAGDQNARTLGGVKPGQKVDVQVLLNQEFANAAGFRVILKFDLKKVEVVGWKKDGTSFGSAIDLPARAKGDSVDYGASILGGTTTATKGAVAVLTFQTLSDYSGDTEITLKSLAIRVSGVFNTLAPGASVVLSSGGSKTPTADFDGDGEVGFNDFFAFASAFGLKATGANVKFDLDGDGDIGFGDFFAFAGEFGKKLS